MSQDLIKVVESIDVIPLIKFYFMNEKNIRWAIHGHKGRQSGIQYKQGEDPFEGSVGFSKGDELLHDTLHDFTCRLPHSVHADYMIFYKSFTSFIT